MRRFRLDEKQKTNEFASEAQFEPHIKNEIEAMINYAGNPNYLL